MPVKVSIVINTYNRSEKLAALLVSIYQSKRDFPYEIIVVDDCSKPSYETEIRRKYPEVVWRSNHKRRFLVYSRNKGWRQSRGKIIFFLDDDNEIKDADFFQKALELLEHHPEVGILGCRTYYFSRPEYILVGPTKFNKTTGITNFIGRNGEDTPKLAGLSETHDTPNAFFARREVLRDADGFSSKLMQTFSEADFAEKVRRLGYRVMHAAALKVYHHSPQVTRYFSLRQMGGSPERLYYLTRNRFWFIKKWGSRKERLLFAVVFSPLLHLYYLWCWLAAKDRAVLFAGLRGIIAGYKYMLTGK